CLSPVRHPAARHPRLVQNNRIGRIDPLVGTSRLLHLRQFRLARNRLHVSLNQSVSQSRKSRPDIFPHFPSVESLDLSQNGLEFVPPLMLSRNRLQFFGAGSFYIEGGGLHSLDLSNNRVASMNREIAYGLDELQILQLSHNDIRTVQTDAFEQLKKLQKLYLDHNQLSFIGGIFDPLSRLEVLRLSSNPNLAQLPSNAFGGLHRLKELDLSNNSIHVIDDKTAHYQCGLCSLRAFVSWLRSKGFARAEVSVLCASPPALRGHRFLICEAKSQAATARSAWCLNLLLSLAVQAAQSALAWWRPGSAASGGDSASLLSKSEYSNLVLAPDQRLRRLLPLLTVTVSSSQAAVYSLAATIRVLSPPRFVQRPKPLYEANEGDSVEIPCASVGFPKPEQSLRRLGNFPAAVENAGGRVETAFNLEVLTSPKFVSDSAWSARVGVRPGGDLVLDCKADANPAPNYAWYFNDQLLNNRSESQLRLTSAVLADAWRLSLATLFGLVSRRVQLWLATGRLLKWTTVPNVLTTTTRRPPSPPVSTADGGDVDGSSKVSTGIPGGGSGAARTSPC
uniref:Ig-like domain-containing protein n=1 Tax=Macrostomum lignano TaxID=282301 RepID=A0A1I8FNM4_9PLAT